MRFTRLTPTHHRFEAVSSDGASQRHDMETRSLLTHDFVHFALESEAGLKQSFFGLLAEGRSYDELAMPASGEAAQTEGVVGALQSALKGEIDAASFVSGYRTYCAAIGSTPPAWLTADVIDRAVARFRALEGLWRATPFGEAMELSFPPRATAAQC